MNVLSNVLICGEINYFKSIYTFVSFIIIKLNIKIIFFKNLANVDSWCKKYVDSWGSTVYKRAHQLSTWKC